jgi:hypothetical protein
MEDEKKFDDLEELYKETPLIEDKEKNTKKQTSPSTNVPVPKRKADSLKNFNVPKKKKEEEDILKTPEEIKKEEQEKKELVLKIEAACHPELLGSNEQVVSLRKEVKLNQLGLKELKALWSKIMTINGSDHPRHFIYQAAIGIARRAEVFLEQYPMLSAPGFSKRLEQNPLFKTKLHMWALDKFDHSELSNELSLLYNILNEYQAAREVGQKKQMQQEIWGNQTVSQDIVEKFADL